MDGAVVQPVVTDGAECLVGMVSDPTFGPLIAFGLCGVLAEMVGGVAFRIHPLTNVDADKLIARVKASRLLHGYRNCPLADEPALRDLLRCVSQLVEDIPELVEMDVNPVMVRPGGRGALALDAHLQLSRRT